MRILVYGAGVQGCQLAHSLAQNKKNVVTLLARGEWKEVIDQKGLTLSLIHISGRAHPGHPDSPPGRACQRTDQLCTAGGTHPCSGSRAYPGCLLYTSRCV